MRDYLLDRFGVTMTPADAGEVLHSSTSHVRAMCQRGDLPAVRIGERWHIPTVKFAQLFDSKEEQ